MTEEIKDLPSAVINPDEVPEPPVHVPSAKEVFYQQQVNKIRLANPGRRILAAQPGPQTQLLAMAEVDIIIFGGSAGGGKTMGLIQCPLSAIQKFPGYDAVLFRRTLADAKKPGSVIRATDDWYPGMGAKYHGTDHKWTFPNKSGVTIAHIQHEKNLEDWKGGAFGAALWDELTAFTSRMFWYMPTRMRGVGGGRPFSRATTNPQHEGWVKDFLVSGTYVDRVTGWVNYDMAGVIQYIYRQDEGEVYWFKSREEAIIWWSINDPKEYAKYKAGKRKAREPWTFTFIPSRLDDNQLLLKENPEYLQNLENQSRRDRMELLYGCWNAPMEKGMYFRPDWVKRIVQEHTDRIITDIIGSNHYDLCRGWDYAYTAKEEGKDPDFTVGILMAYHKKTRMYYILDIEQGRYAGPDFDAFVGEVAQKDIAVYGQNKVTISLPNGGFEKQISANLVNTVLAGLPVHTSPERGNKESRFQGFAAMAKTGMLRIPLDIPNYSFWVNQLVSFKGSKHTKGHDDAVDATSRAFNYLAQGVRTDIFDVM